MAQTFEVPPRVVEIMGQDEHPNRRPKDAATLIVLDRQADGPVRVLMGRRHMRHKFMPGRFVFPGGRVDPADSRVPYAADYAPDVLARLSMKMKGPKTPARARAFAIAAIRETYEEAGLFIGRPDTDGAPGRGDWAAFRERRILPTLDGFHFIARAITPPRRVRRFDTRFLAVWADAIVDRLPEGHGPTDELEDLHWLTFEEAGKLEMPFITQTILVNLDRRLQVDPDLSQDYPVPFVYRKNNKFHREDL